ncbi:MAG: DUF4149 domain-containing protein [Planctomycetota bacterium]
MRDDRRFIEWFGGLALSVWVGGLATIIIVAMAVFGELSSDRGLAGSIVGAILSQFRRLELVCAAAVFFGACFLLSRPTTRRDLARLVLAALMAGIFASYALWVAPKLLEVRRQITNFDLPAERDPSSARRAFQSLHQLYSGLSLTNLVIGVVLWSIWRRPAPIPEPPKSP